MTKKFTGLLMGMGNPLLDISANVSPDMLKKYNVQLDTAILAEEQHLPIYQELIDSYPVQYIAGGATQNTCRVAQWMLSAAGKPRESVAFLGCVGAHDAYGQQLQACAAADGVCVHYQKDPEHPTGTCAALIVDGERALIAHLGAANHFSPTHLTESATSQEILASAQIVYCAGFFLTVSLPSLVYAAEHVVKENKIFALNLSAPFIVDFFSEQLHTALEYADYLFGNESEAATYAKKHGLVPEDDLHQVALALAASPKRHAARDRTVVITQGSKATIVAYQGRVTEYPIEDALEADKIVDTNGAGDAFVGGFLASLLLQPGDVAAAVRAGHYAAKHIIQVSGTQLSEPCAYSF